MSSTHTGETGADQSLAGVRGGRERKVCSKRGWVAWAAMLALLLAAGVLSLYETRGMTLTFDEWDWALGRRDGSLATFLDPHNAHLSLIPVAIYKLLFAVAGLRHYLPYRVMVTVAHLGCAALVFTYARRRTSDAVALLAAALLLFLGPAWQNFLWPFQVAWLISIGTGIGALLLLDLRSRGADLGACALLSCSLASSAIGLAVAAGLCIDVLARHDRRRRSWIVLVPLLAYGLWWIGYQHATTSSSALTHAPAFIAKEASAMFAGLAGLSGNTVPFGSGTLLSFGPPLAALAAALLAVSLLRHPQDRSPRVAALIGIVGAFWALAAAGRRGLAAPYSSRYIYVGGCFTLLLAAELLRGTRLRRSVVALAAVLVLAAVISNLRVFGYAGNFERSEAQLTAADLGALNIGRRLIPPGYVPIRFPGFGLRFTASAFFATQHAIASPAAGREQIATLPEGVREAADAELVSIHRLRPIRVPTTVGTGIAPQTEARKNAAVRTSTGCLSVQAASAGAPAVVELTLPEAGVLIRTTASSTALAVRRFGAGFQILGTIPGPATSVLAPGSDGSRIDWHLRVQGPAPTKICGLR